MKGKYGTGMDDASDGFTRILRPFQKRYFANEYMNIIELQRKI